MSVPARFPALPGAGPIGDPARAILDAQLEELARLAPARRRRRTVQLIDRALDQVELRNRAGLGAMRPPAAAAALVGWLQCQAGERERPPASSREAHDELFRLQAGYLPTIDDEDIDDPVPALGVVPPQPAEIPVTVVEAPEPDDLVEEQPERAPSRAVGRRRRPDLSARVEDLVDQLITLGRYACELEDEVHYWRAEARRLVRLASAAVERG